MDIEEGTETPDHSVGSQTQQNAASVTVLRPIYIILGHRDIQPLVILIIERETSKCITGHVSRVTEWLEPRVIDVGGSEQVKTRLRLDLCTHALPRPTV